MESQNNVNEYETLDICLGIQTGVQIRREWLQNLDVLAMSTDLMSGEAESAGRAEEYVGKEAFGELGGVEEKRPKQSSGQVVRR